VLDKSDSICYNLLVRLRETREREKMEALKKIKKLKKPLDKLKKMCYNKYIRNGDELQKNLRVAT
jgi:hypothetical protein